LRQDAAKKRVLPQGVAHRAARRVFLVGVKNRLMPCELAASVLPALEIAHCKRGHNYPFIIDFLSLQIRLLISPKISRRPNDIRDPLKNSKQFSPSKNTAGKSFSLKSFSVTLTSITELHLANWANYYRLY
jgi:hypothetical protein